MEKVRKVAFSGSRVVGVANTSKQAMLFRPFLFWRLEGIWAALKPEFSTIRNVEGRVLIARSATCSWPKGAEVGTPPNSALEDALKIDAPPTIRYFSLPEHDWLVMAALSDAITVALERLHNRPSRADKGGLRLAIEALEDWLCINWATAPKQDRATSMDEPEALPNGPFTHHALRAVLVHVVLEHELSEITPEEHAVLERRLAGKDLKDGGFCLIC